MRTRREERLLAEPENEHEDRFARLEIAVANLHDFVANHINTRLSRVEGTLYVLVAIIVAAIGAALGYIFTNG